MRGDQESVDLVVRGGEIVLSASSVAIGGDSIVLAGTLLDPEVRAATGAVSPVSTVIQMSLGPELVGGEHVVGREATWTLETDEGARPVEWFVTSRELSDGFAMQDAQARVDDLEVRAFAIEDLAVTVGVCLAGGIGALATWLQHKRLESAQSAALQAAKEHFRECLESGGSPWIRFGVNGEATTTLTPQAELKIKQGASYEASCDRPR